MKRQKSHVADELNNHSSLLTPHSSLSTCRGRKPVLDLLTKTPSRCSRLLIASNVRPPFLDEVMQVAKDSGVAYEIVAPEILDKLSNGERHQGVVCELVQAKPVELDEFLKTLDDSSPALLVILDHIEDPHNLGAIIRSAEAGGASGVIIAKRRSAVPNDTVIKTSAGASLRLPLVQVANIARTLEALKEKNFWVVGLSEKSEASIWSDKLPARCAMVVGAEGSGISRLVMEGCDMLMKIPIKGGGVGSLNASVAAALGIFEWARGQES
ncbi:MAG: 23S rRNA (guanosine(2251)-2'-O)-methyltransferase RlmB [Synergistaceae bacterium]|nr:23S rRNA (guanosine(2251)-2'-O)-methyltransferase RlmB [Synergistaceae bacterium]